MESSQPFSQFSPSLATFNGDFFKQFNRDEDIRSLIDFTENFYVNQLQAFTVLDKPVPEADESNPANCPSPQVSHQSSEYFAKEDRSLMISSNSFVWTKMQEGNGAVAERLLMEVNPSNPADSNISYYDCDFGFKVLANLYEYSSNAFVLGSSTVPLYLIRKVQRPRGSRKFSLAHLSISSKYPLKPLSWFDCSKDDTYMIGLDTTKSCYFEKFEVGNGIFVLLMQIDSKRFYLNLYDILSSHLYGKHLITTCYGEVYQGQHISFISSSGDSFKYQVHGLVALKTSHFSSFYQPLAITHKMPKSTKELSQCFLGTENVLKEIEYMNFLSKTASSDSVNRFLPCLNASFDSHNIYSFTPFYQRGSLFEYFCTRTCAHIISEEEIRHIVGQLLQACNCLHSFGLSHRDISLENVLMDHRPNSCTYNNCLDFDYVLMDYGQMHAQEFSANSFQLASSANLSRCVGKPYFFCPELSGHNISGTTISKFDNYDPAKVDIWQIGIVMFILLDRQPPFQSSCQESLSVWFEEVRSHNVLNRTYNHLPSQNHLPVKLLKEVLSPSACDVFNSMIAYDPNDRKPAQELLSMTWFQTQN